MNTPINRIAFVLKGKCFYQIIEEDTLPGYSLKDGVLWANRVAAELKAEVFICRLMEIPGVCRKCGCTPDNPCEGGCDWANSERTLCTSCTC